MQVEDLNDRAVRKHLKTITDNLNDLDIDEKRVVLEEIVGVLNLLSQDDFFGTEGWQHAFGMEG